MFTGIIENMGRVLAVERKGLTRITVQSPYRDLKLGESVAVNGTCLTVYSLPKKPTGAFVAELSEETLRRTTFRHVRPGEAVNLERPLRLSDRIGGHFLQGHVDATGKIVDIAADNGSDLYAFSYPKGIEPYLVEKGSVGIHGISLTIAQIRPGSFTVSILPYTARETTLGGMEAGDEVNLEADMIAKIVAKQVGHYKEAGRK